MRFLLKKYYRKQLAEKRRKEHRRQIKPVRAQPVTFIGLDDDFCTKTILSRIAHRDERVPLDKRLRFLLTRECLRNISPWSKDSMLSQFAEKVEQTLALMLVQSVQDFHCGHSAGYCTHKYDLGTKDEPIRINVENALEIGARLTNCIKDIPSIIDEKSYLLIPAFMANMMRAKASWLTFAEPFPSFPRHIRNCVSDIGTFWGNQVYINKDITGNDTAYLIREGTLLWNFRFKHNLDIIRDIMYIELQYGLGIVYPEYIVKMNVSEDTGI